MSAQFHVISTGSQSLREWLDKTVEIYHYVDFIHIRERSWSTEKVSRAVKLAKEKGVPQKKLVLNNLPLLAEKLQVAGVHYPEKKEIQDRKCPTLLRGSSIHGVRSAIKKEQEGADYLFFGHIFESKSKPGAQPKGLKALEEVVSSVRIPVIAIGGIALHRVKDCLAAGAMGIAVLSGVYGAKNPQEEAKSFNELIKGESYNE